MDKVKTGMKDITRLFGFIYIFTLLLLIAKFCVWFFFGVMINIDLDKLAICLNLFIVIVGTAEGFRSVMKTAVNDESMPVPAYKLKFLFKFLVSFVALTIVAVALEVATKIVVTQPNSIIPNYSTDELLNGVISNVIAYLLARYGNKVSESIDLSSVRLFKK